MTLAHDYAAEAMTPMPQTEDTLTLETRFGEFTFAADQALEMPSGMVGFPEHKAYGLATPHDEKHKSFVIMQCLTEPSLGFVTAPIAKEDGPIDEADLREAFETHGVAWEDAAILLICTIRGGGDGGSVSLSVNLQAPIIIDAKRRRAWQHVFHGGKYPVRQDLI